MATRAQKRLHGLSEKERYSIAKADLEDFASGTEICPGAFMIQKTLALYGLEPERRDILAIQGQLESEYLGKETK